MSEEIRIIQAHCQLSGSQNPLDRPRTRPQLFLARRFITAYEVVSATRGSYCHVEFENTQAMQFLCTLDQFWLWLRGYDPFKDTGEDMEFNFGDLGS